MALHDRIKEARLNAGMTQQQVSAILDIAKSTVSSYESGTREPPPLTIAQMLKLFGVDANFLFQDEMAEKANKEKGDLTNRELQLIEKYRFLDPHGSKMVDMVLDAEYERCKEDSDNDKILKFSVERETGKVVARNGREISEDAKQLLKNLNF